MEYHGVSRNPHFSDVDWDAQGPACRQYPHPHPSTGSCQFWDMDGDMTRTGLITLLVFSFPWLNKHLNKHNNMHPTAHPTVPMLPYLFDDPKMGFGQVPRALPGTVSYKR